MSSSQNWSIDATDRGLAEDAKKKVKELQKNKVVQERLKTIKVLNNFGEVVRVINY